MSFLEDASFYRFNMVVSGSCTAFASFVIFILMFMHATHLSKPNEQIKSVLFQILY
jgi:Organic solute transporter Ostalpha